MKKEAYDAKQAIAELMTARLEALEVEAKAKKEVTKREQSKVPMLICVLNTAKGVPNPPHSPPDPP